MNKNDIKLIIALIIIILVCFIVYFLTKTPATTAKVYYENDLLLTIDLNINNIYTVSGKNGNVIIEVKDKQIRVKEENSPYHICSKQGFISNSNQTLVCLPNKIIVTIGGDSIDAQVK